MKDKTKQGYGLSYWANKKIEKPTEISFANKRLKEHNKILETGVELGIAQERARISNIIENNFPRDEFPNTYRAIKKEIEEEKP